MKTLPSALQLCYSGYEGMVNCVKKYSSDKIMIGACETGYKLVCVVSSRGKSSSEARRRREGGKHMTFTFNGTNHGVTEVQTIQGFDDRVLPVWAQQTAAWVPSQDWGAMSPTTAYASAAECVALLEVVGLASVSESFWSDDQRGASLVG